ncbi:hypothetical protein [Actinoplanes sp. NBRC 101535]|uniref:hypothetical protein n=1 Tax=Actinoplanes sp. NBRC 101535 TaxID=3032196 RepID=UPI0025536C3C|nr:hypothetical protein [Actinoplanes sp. NBRC 101535]
MTPPFPSFPSLPSRPATVTVAFGLQLAVAGALVLFAAVTVVGAVHYDGLIDVAARETAAAAADVQSERSSNTFGATFTVVLALMLATWLGVTAIGLYRGSSVARVLSLIGLIVPLALNVLACLLGSLAVLLLFGLLAGEPEGVDDFGEQDFGSGDFEEWAGELFYERLEELDTEGLSVAVELASTLAGGVAFLAAVTTVVLLFTTSARRHFQPPARAWGYPPAQPFAPMWPQPPVHQQPVHQPPVHQQPVHQQPVHPDSGDRQPPAETPAPPGDPSTPAS